VIAVSFLISLKVMDWLAPRATVQPPALVELPPLPPAQRSSVVMAPVAVAAVGDPRGRRPRRAAQFQRQGRQSGFTDPAERRHRLDRPARADLGTAPRTCCRCRRR